MSHCMSYEKNGERQSLREIDDLIVVEVFGEQPDPKHFHWAFNCTNFAVACGKSLRWLSGERDFDERDNQMDSAIIAVAKWLLENGYKEDAWREIGRS